MKSYDAPLTTPFFVPTFEDLPRLAALRHDLDMKALSCLEGARCERVHFERAVVSLFENREAARASFRRVIEDSPASSLAATSKLWLRSMDSEEETVALTDGASRPVTEIMVQYVREWMERQITERAALDKPSPAPILPALPDPQAEQARIVQAMYKQLRERDRQIAKLRAQLEALKLIDQEQQQKIRPPAALKTLEHPAQ